MNSIIKLILSGEISTYYLVENHKSSLISIEIEEYLLFIEISYLQFPHILLSQLKDKLVLLFNTNDLHINFIEDNTQESINIKKHSISYKVDNTIIFLHFPLDTLIIFAKKLSLISIYYKKSTFHDLYCELYRFQPQFLQKNIWYSLTDQELQLLFNYMLHNNLVSIYMLAVFFKVITLPNLQKYFSSRITKIINLEIQNLGYLPEIISKVVYYLIECNLILFLSKKNIPSLNKYYQQITDYKEYLYYYSISRLVFSDLRFSKYYSKNLLSILNTIPSKSLIIFLKYSPKDNLSFLRKFYSQEGYNNLTMDIQYITNPSIESDPILKKIAYLEYKSIGNSFSELLYKYIKTARDWELLARECNLQELLVAINTLDKKYLSSLSGIIQLLYSLYSSHQIIFPHKLKNYNSQILENCSIIIIYLDLLKLLSSYNNL